jgi:hypothetical protein
MSLDRVSRDDWIVGGLALLLVIGLFAFPWFSISVGPFSVTSTASGSPDGWLGILAVIVLIALIADLAIERFSPQTKLPMVGGSRERTRLALAGLAALLLLLKFLFHISNFSDLGWGFWFDAVLTVLLVLATLRASQGQSVLARRGGAATP